MWISIKAKNDIHQSWSRAGKHWRMEDFSLRTRHLITLRSQIWKPAWSLPSNAIRGAKSWLWKLSLAVDKWWGIWDVGMGGAWGEGGLCSRIFNIWIINVSSKCVENKNGSNQAMERSCKTHHFLHSLMSRFQKWLGCGYSFHQARKRSRGIIKPACLK